MGNRQLARGLTSKVSVLYDRWIAEQLHMRQGDLLSDRVLLARHRFSDAPKSKFPLSVARLVDIENYADAIR